MLPSNRSHRLLLRQSDAEAIGTSVVDARLLAVSILLSNGLLATISALIWIVISAFTGAPASFVILGAILCGFVVFVVGYSIRRVAIHR
jgi:hypothetical protein